MCMEIKAPMPGKIASISVSVGSQVKEEDEVIIMDAMKMEIPVYAPGSGIVKEIKVKWASPSTKVSCLLSFISANKLEGYSSGLKETYIDGIGAVEEAWKK